MAATKRTTTQAQSKTSRTKKHLLIATAFAIPLFITSGVSSQAQQAQCQNLSNNNEIISQCIANAGANNSWLSWFSGNSRSTQFQMIDLFELVNRPSENAQSGVLTSREG